MLLGAPLVARQAICGNQVCEPGERAPIDANNLGAKGSMASGQLPRVLIMASEMESAALSVNPYLDIVVQI